MMGRATTQVRRLLGPLDPANGKESLVTAPERAADLQRIMAMPQPAAQAAALRTAPRRRFVLAGAGMAAALAVVAVGVNVFGRPAGPAFAVTPVPLAFHKSAGAQSAAEVLEGIASRVDRLPAERRGGNYRHFLQSNWYLWTKIDGERVISAVVPERNELWIAENGSGREVARYDDPVFQSDADRKVWHQQGSPGEDNDEQVRTYHIGQHSFTWKNKAPADPAELKTWLEFHHPVANGPGEVMAAITDLVREQVLEPAQRAALLRVLAQVPGLSYDATATDRAGRAGQAFSLMSDYGGLPERYTVVVDAATGKLLYREELLLRAGKLKVKVPAVIGYETYLKADYTSLPR